MEEKYNLEYQYQEYLKVTGMSEDRMPPTQIVELRKAYMAACTGMLLLLRNDIGAIEDEEEAMKIVESMLDQGIEYFEKIVKEG